jgi:hypothetical protein
MTISTYQVDNLIKAYNKQIRQNLRSSVTQGLRSKGLCVDLISQTTDVDKEDSYQKISDSLLNDILKGRA